MLTFSCRCPLSLSHFLCLRTYSSHVGTSVSTQRKRTRENVQEISLPAEDASSKRRRGPTTSVGNRRPRRSVHHSSTAHCFKAPSWNYLALSEFTKENGDTDHQIGRIAMEAVSTAAVQVVGNPSLQISLNGGEDGGEAEKRGWG
ncbi:hypothetical protein Tco_1151197 [Tanacetum coccineum]